MKSVYYINLDGVRTKAALHEQISSALELPDYYGRNLDALYDLLSESPELDLIFYNTEKAEISLPAYFPALRRMCADAAASCGHRIRFYP